MKVIFDMKQYKLIKIIGETALCETNKDDDIYILTKDLPSGAQAGDQLMQDSNGKLHVCNLIILGQ